MAPKAKNKEVRMSGVEKQPKERRLLPRRLIAGGAAAVLIAAIAGGAFAIVPPPPASEGEPAAVAQADPAPEEVVYDEAAVRLGQRVWQEKINCGTCHGWNGAGVPDDPRSPVGANLRESLLTPEQFAEVVRCGRISTDMPAFDARAYVDDRCYGLTTEDLGENTPQKRGTYLIGREIDGLVAYVYTVMVGQGESTREECVEYWGPNAPVCDAFEPAAAP